MINRKYDKIIFDLIKTNAYLFLIFASMFVLYGSISFYKSNLFDKLQESETLAEPVKSFDEETIKFISEHNFSKKRVKFQKFVENIANHNFAVITEVSKADDMKSDDFRKTQYKIRGYFWHDKFIFNFLDELQNFHPGFLKLLNVDIDKFSKVNESKPFMKLEIVCEIFQKA